MESNHKNYNFEDSLCRLDEILNASDNSYEEKMKFPDEVVFRIPTGFM